MEGSPRNMKIDVGSRGGSKSGSGSTPSSSSLPEASLSPPGSRPSTTQSRSRSLFSRSGGRKERKPEKQPVKPETESGIKHGNQRLYKKINDVWMDDFLTLRTMSKIHVRQVQSLHGYRPCYYCGTPVQTTASGPKKVKDDRHTCGGKPPYKNVPPYISKNQKALGTGRS